MPPTTPPTDLDFSAIDRGIVSFHVGKIEFHIVVEPETTKSKLYDLWENHFPELSAWWWGHDAVCISPDDKLAIWIRPAQKWDNHPTE